jgi:molybdate transport system substrate-binding protein
MALRALLGFAILAVACRREQGKQEPLVVFAAASTHDALGELARTFEQREDVKVQLSFGASSEMSRQIQAGAPADVFLSADLRSIDVLEPIGLVRERRLLLGNRLVVVAHVASDAKVTAPSDLARFATIATGDPEAVPVGVYTKAWLQKAGAWDAVQAKLVRTVDVRAALAAVESRATEVGIVYATDARVAKSVKVLYEVPLADQPEIRYPIATIAKGAHPAADRFVEFLFGAEAKVVFERHGFVVP